MKYAEGFKASIVKRTQQNKSIKTTPVAFFLGNTPTGVGKTPTLSR